MFIPFALKNLVLTIILHSESPLPILFFSFYRTT